MARIVKVLAIIILSIYSSTKMVSALESEQTGTQPNIFDN